MTALVLLADGDVNRADIIGWLFKIGGPVAVVVALVWLVWWLLQRGRDGEKESDFRQRTPSLRPVSDDAVEIDPRWGPPFDGSLHPRTPTAHDATVGTLAGSAVQLFTLVFGEGPAAVSPEDGVPLQTVGVSTARFRHELPRLQVRRRSGDRDTTLPGMPAYRTGHAEFDQRYEVATQNEQLARDLLTPSMCATLLRADVASLRIAATHLLVLQPGQLPAFGVALEPHITRLRTILTALPASLAALR